MIRRLYQLGDRSSHLRVGQSQSREEGQRGGQPGRGSKTLSDAFETESRKT